MSGPFAGELKYDAISEPATEAAVSPRCYYVLVTSKAAVPVKTTGGRPPTYIKLLYIMEDL